MASPIKHIGQNTTNGAGVVVVFRQITDEKGNVIEKDNCLVAYPDTLPLTEHQDIMRIVESEPAQRTGNLWEALNRDTVTNGANALQWLHNSGYLKKVSTSEINLTPAPGHSFPLADINRIVELQASGLSEQQINNIMTDDTNKAPRQNSMINAEEGPAPVAPGIPAPETVTEAKVAEQPAVQQEPAIVADPATAAKDMMSQAKEMLRMAEELKAQAIELDPSVKPSRGRPAKA